MATPVAHSLLGVSGLWEFGGSGRKGKWLGVVLCILWANLPDLDYVPGLLTGHLNAYHQGPTHSIVFCLLAGLSGLLFAPIMGISRKRGALLATGLCLSHLVLDFFTLDFRPPIGILLLWPLSTKVFNSPWGLFLPPDKANLMEMLSLWNLWVVLVELLVFGSIAFLAWRKHGMGRMGGGGLGGRT